MKKILAVVLASLALICLGLATAPTSADLVRAVPQQGAGGGGGGGTTLPVDDGTAIVKGSADATKLLRFEMDTDVATGTTRVLTIPSSDATIALSQGSPGGIQLFGRFGVGTNNGAYFGGNSEATASFAINVRAENTPDSGQLLVNQAISRALLLTEMADETFDFAHANPTNPTLFVHSANQSTTEFTAYTFAGPASSRNTVTVDAATTFALTSGYIVLTCTGAETINTITGAPAAGTVLYIENTDTECTIADDDSPTAVNAIDLTGAATADVGAVAKVITLIYNGSHWLQTAESDN